MADRLTKARRSWLMSRIRGVHTLPEKQLREALRRAGVVGWRSYGRGLPGTPDLTFRRWRVAIFVDGAFWHGHPSKFAIGKLPKFWEQKILRNRERDRRDDAALRSLGWRVIRVWDIDLRKRLQRVLAKILRCLLARGCPAPPNPASPNTPSVLGRKFGRAARDGSASRSRLGRADRRASRIRKPRSSPRA